MMLNTMSERDREIVRMIVYEYDSVEMIAEHFDIDVEIVEGVRESLQLALADYVPEEIDKIFGSIISMSWVIEHPLSSVATTV